MKLAITILLFCFLSSFVIQDASGQYITKKWNKYSYEGVQYKKDDLGVILNQSNQSRLFYQEAISNYRRGKKYLVFGAAFVGISVGFWRLSSNNLDNPSPAVPQALMLRVLAIASGFTGVYLGITGNNFLFTGKRKMKSAVNHFNLEVQEKLKRESSYLNLGITQNGLGFVYSF